MRGETARKLHILMETTSLTSGRDLQCPEGPRIYKAYAWCYKRLCYWNDSEGHAYLWKPSRTLHNVGEHSSWTCGELLNGKWKTENGERKGACLLCTPGLRTFFCWLSGFWRYASIESATLGWTESGRRKGERTSGKARRREGVKASKRLKPKHT